MRTLDAIVRAPFALPDGEMVMVAGYHAGTRTFVDFDGEAMGGVPSAPTRQEVVAALEQLWRPWASYKFSTPHDRAGMLAAILQVVCRPGVSTAPGVVLDAPTPGSGKTLAAQALGALVLGRRCPATVGVNFGDEDEVRKLLVADALAGNDVLLLDNLHGHLSSAALEGLITAGALRGRVLGGSQVFEGTIRNTVLLTSNNASFSRDLARRFIRVRIDHGVESPQSLEFRFCPVERALTERLSVAHAVMVVVAGYFAAGSPAVGRGDAGFPEWNRLVRQTVLWVRRDGLANDAGIGDLGDPAHFLMEEAGRSDPDSEALALLLDGLRQKFGSEWFRVREVVAWLSLGGGEANLMVREALELLMPGRGAGVTSGSLGNVLKFRLDRPACGLVLRRGDGGKNTAVFSVQEA